MTTLRISAIITWLVASIFYAYQFILRVMPSILMHDIMYQFQINETTFGQFSGIYYIGYSLIHLPIGIMLDRYGPRKIMTGCILLTVSGLLPLLFADHWIYPITGRFLMGIGSSAAILGLFKIIRMTFSEKRFPRMLSFSVTIGLLGAIYGGGPLSYMRDEYGYSFVIQFFCFIGVILAAVTYLTIPDLSESHQGTIFADVKKVLSNKRVVLVCLCAGLMVGPIQGFADVWGAAFFKQFYGFDKSIAASLPSFIFVGMCFGAPVLSLIADKVKNYLGTIVAAGLTMTACFFLFTTRDLSYSSLSFSLILVGVCSAYQILAIYKATTYVDESVAGITTAVANMIIMIFGYFFHAVMGYTINLLGGAQSSTALVQGITIIPIGLAFGTLGFIYLSIVEKNRIIEV